MLPLLLNIHAHKNPLMGSGRGEDLESMVHSLALGTDWSFEQFGNYTC